MKKFFTLATLMITLISFSQETVLLRYNYKKGDNYLLKMNMEQDMGKLMVMDMKMNMSYKIKDVKDTIFNLELGFTEIKTDVKSGKENISYNSNTKEADMNKEQKKMHQSMKKLLELVVAGKCTHRGKMYDFKVIKGEGFSSQFTNQMNSVIYPEKPVKVGDYWEGEQDKATEGIKTKMNYKYTVKAINKKTVDVRIEGTISGVLSGTITGDMVIDKETGNNAVVNMNMEMNMFEQTIKSTISTTCEKQ